MQHWSKSTIFIAVLVILLTGALSIALVFGSPYYDRQVLKQRAGAIWNARVKEDWASVYRYLSPAEKNNSTQQQFVEARNTRGPFQFLAAELKDTAVDGDIGWVKVSYSVKPKMYTDATATQVENWDVWTKQNRQWYPVPAQLNDQFPRLPPEERSAEEEKYLAERFQDYWSARKTKDWEKIYQYLEPDYRQIVSQERFIKTIPPYAYLSHQLEWIEVIDNKARIKIAYTYKVDDPSLAKLPAKENEQIENWIKVDGQWYQQRPMPKEKGI